MGTYRLTSYINKLEKHYEEAREKYNLSVNELSKLEESHKQKINSGELSAVGIKHEYQQYTEKKNKLMHDISEAREAFNKSAESVRNSVNVIFRDLYCVKPESVDLQGVELIKSGILTETEILELANRYKEQGNLTMYRYCGTLFDTNDRDANIRHLANEARRMRTRTDLQIIDEFIDVCQKGIRDDVSLSNGIDRRHPDFYANAYAKASSINCEVSTPWEAD